MIYQLVGEFCRFGKLGGRVLGSRYAAGFFWGIVVGGGPPAEPGADLGGREDGECVWLAPVKKGAMIWV